ncbi:MAG: hypothetical protein U5N26_01500 [Candidatus Marinimicrobia bacterium]|nr:hypothetical protein [Candidatus Neomarinimicrobiota bacterium]
MNDLSPGIAHFIKHNRRYIFKDTYNQFPGSPGAVHDIAVAGDSIFIASDGGIYRGWLHSANLKPAAAWSPLPSVNETVHKLFAFGDSLYYADEDQTLYRYHQGDKALLFTAEDARRAFSGRATRCTWQRNMMFTMCLPPKRHMKVKTG